MRRFRQRLFAMAALGFATLAVGCESREAAERRAEEAATEKTVPRGNRPDALSIHFQASRGAGFSREGWELEMLQLGGDVRLRGSIRRTGQIVPVYGTMDESEYAEFWAWVAGLPLDGFRVAEDSTAAPDGWSKRLEVDIVLGPERRIVSRNHWTRPLEDTPWLAELENALLALATEHAAPADTASTKPDSTREAVTKAIQSAIEELESRPGDAAATP